MTTKLYKNGDQMGIWTDADDEYDFIQELSQLWDSLISEKWCVHFDEVAKGETELATDWEFQLSIWLGQVVDIVCKYRGYKTNVAEKKVLFIGNMIPDDFLAEVDSKRNFKFRG